MTLIRLVPKGAGATTSDHDCGCHDHHGEVGQCGCGGHGHEHGGRCACGGHHDHEQE